MTELHSTRLKAQLQTGGSSAQGPFSPSSSRLHITHCTSHGRINTRGTWDSGNLAPSGITPSQEHEQGLHFPRDESQDEAQQGKGATYHAKKEACCSPVTVAVSGLEPFHGDKAGLSTWHEVPAILTAPAEQLCTAAFPCCPSTHAGALNPPPEPCQRGCTRKQEHPPALQLTTSPRHPPM